MAKGGRVRLVVIRAGRTAWDDDARAQGGTDLPLSERGEQQVRSMATTLEVAGMTFGSIFCAPDEASLATAKAVSKAVGGKVRPHEGLGEPGLGLWEGKKLCDLTEQNPKTMRQWREDPTAVCPPSGEALCVARVRIIEAAAKIVDRPLRKAVAIIVRPLGFGVLRSALDELPPEAITAAWANTDEPMVLDRMVTSAMLRSRKQLAKVDA